MDGSDGAWRQRRWSILPGMEHGREMDSSYVESVREQNGDHITSRRCWKSEGYALGTRQCGGGKEMELGTWVGDGSKCGWDMELGAQVEY